MQVKTELRDIIKTILLNNKNKTNNLVVNSIPLLKHCQKIAIYRANDYEISLEPIIKYSLKNKIEIYQPVSYRNSKTMLFEQFIQSKISIFSENSYRPEFECKWYNLDLIFIPLIAVDISGNRLGRGGGYYDATIKTHKKPILCGVGYDVQKLAFIPSNSWDIKLDYFLSNKTLTKF